MSEQTATEGKILDFRGLLVTKDHNQNSIWIFDISLRRSSKSRCVYT